MCFNRNWLYDYIILVALLTTCFFRRINLIFTLIITQTQTNAWTTLTIVAKMPTAPTSKGPSIVAAHQGTLEMATIVQVGSCNSCLAFREFWDFSGSVQLGLMFSNVFL